MKQANRSHLRLIKSAPREFTASDAVIQFVDGYQGVFELVIEPGQSMYWEWAPADFMIWFKYKGETVTCEGVSFDRSGEETLRRLVEADRSGAEEVDLIGCACLACLEAEALYESLETAPWLDDAS